MRCRACKNPNYWNFYFLRKLLLILHLGADSLSQFGKEVKDTPVMLCRGEDYPPFIHTIVTPKETHFRYVSVMAPEEEPRILGFIASSRSSGNRSATSITCDRR